MKQHFPGDAMQKDEINSLHVPTQIWQPIFSLKDFEAKFTEQCAIFLGRLNPNSGGVCVKC